MIQLMCCPVLAPSAAGRVADLKGLGMTLWILVGIVVAIMVLAAMLRPLCWH